MYREIYEIPNFFMRSLVHENCTALGIEFSGSSEKRYICRQISCRVFNVCKTMEYCCTFSIILLREPGIAQHTSLLRNSVRSVQKVRTFGTMLKFKNSCSSTST